MKFLAVLLISATALGQNLSKCGQFSINGDVDKYVECLLGPNLKIYDQVVVKAGKTSTIVDGASFGSSKLVLLNTGNAKTTCIATVDGVDKRTVVQPQGHATLVFAGKSFDTERDTFMCVVRK